MPTLVELMEPVIDATIQRLNSKVFSPDPIAGPHFSRIVSVMSSAYKRHGYIIERAILEGLKIRPELTVWTDAEFQVCPNADLVASGSLKNPSSILGNEIAYGEGPRTLQVDVLVFNEETGSLRSYEVKRGFGAHDAGKRRSILRDALCLQLLLRSYGQFKGVQPKSVGSHVIFYYDKMSVPRPFGLKGSELDDHFGFPLRASIESVNDLFKERLFAILAG